MLNAGVIGMGVGEKHAQAYETHSNVILNKVCDFDRKKLKKLKENHSYSALVNTDHQILEDEDIDIVSIASYDNYHSKQIVQAFENGKHVMAEKPLCMNREEME